MIPGGEVKISREIDIPEAMITLRSDDIVHVHYKKNTTLDVELQERMRGLYLELTEGRNSKFIFSADEGFILTKEARENAGRLHRISPIRHYALIANNLAYKIIANFYVRVFKPKGNFRLFTNVTDAAAWLNSFD